jgi:hypothetical protein
VPGARIFCWDIWNKPHTKLFETLGCKQLNRKKLHLEEKGKGSLRFRPKLRQIKLVKEMAITKAERTFANFRNQVAMKQAGSVQHRGSQFINGADRRIDGRSQRSSMDGNAVGATMLWSRATIVE